MADDWNEQQEVVLLDVHARLQEVEDLIMEHGWKGIVVRTNHGAFEWARGAVEGSQAETPAGAPARRKRRSSGRKVRGVRRHR
jgi:hypothetical protein